MISISSGQSNRHNNFMVTEVTTPEVPMPTDFPGAFRALRDILRKHAEGLVVLNDSPTDYTVASPALGPNGKPMWFGSVQSRKSAVSYHLMPLYFNPKLEATIAPELLPRKQGKTCFNFQRPDLSLFSHLDELTAKAREQWESRGFLSPGTISGGQVEQAVKEAGADMEALARRRNAVAAKRGAARKTKATPAKARRTRAK
jgi:hypothetical protein